MSVFHDVCPTCVWGEKGECKEHPIKPPEVEGSDFEYENELDIPKMEMLNGAIHEPEGPRGMVEEIGAGIEGNEGVDKAEIDHDEVTEESPAYFSHYPSFHESLAGMMGKDPQRPSHHSPFINPASSVLDVADKGLYQNQKIKDLLGQGNLKQ